MKALKFQMQFYKWNISIERLNSKVEVEGQAEVLSRVGAGEEPILFLAMSLLFLVLKPYIPQITLTLDSEYLDGGIRFVYGTSK